MCTVGIICIIFEFTNKTFLYQLLRLIKFHTILLSLVFMRIEHVHKYWHIGSYFVSRVLLVGTIATKSILASCPGTICSHLQLPTFISST